MTATSTARSTSLGLDANWGFIHSEENGSALDGPGLRTVFCLAGCSLPCRHHHGPDSRELRAGRRVHVDALVRDVREYAPFLATVHGGVTLSGGEPLVQQAFCINLFRRLHELDIHTALDTNGYLGHRLSDRELRAIDLVILDLKSWDDATHVRITGEHNQAVFEFARRLRALGRPVWIRFLLVPGITDQPNDIEGLARFCGEHSNIERVEVVPFHRLGRSKWHQLGLDYPLDGARPPTDELLESVRDTFRRHGCICPD